jgi:hypothetical protein
MTACDDEDYDDDYDDNYNGLRARRAPEADEAEGDSDGLSPSARSSRPSRVEGKGRPTTASSGERSLLKSRGRGAF